MGEFGFPKIGDAFSKNVLAVIFLPLSFFITDSSIISCSVKTVEFIPNVITSATTAVYAYAATAGYTLMEPGANEAFMNMDVSNPLVLVVLSIVGGCLFAMGANKVNTLIS